MKIKRYVVRNMHEGFTVIRRDLGPEAIIISSKKIREGGLLGIFLPKKLEVTAAVEDGPRENQVAAVPVKQEKLEKEIAEMKQILSKLVNNGENLPRALEKWHEFLLSREIAPEIAAQLVQNLEHIDTSNTGEVLAQLEQTMIPLLDKEQDINGGVTAFIGPTGVGKTTTIAKLAAQYVLNQGKKVALVTIDTYRIGAVEQLKTYSEIIGIPIEVVMTPKELKTTIENHRDKDVILVDTAGRPSKNTMQILELRGFLEQLKPAEICLVLSCTTRARDLLRIAEDFKQVNYNSLIFTKVDETETLGPIINVVQHTDLPVRYITNGQNVPDDIEEAVPERLVKLILGAVNNA